MISKEDAWAILDAEAAKLKALTYDELEKIAAELPGSPHSEWREWQEATVRGERLHVDVLLGEWGLFRRRISVELVANTDDGTLTPAVVPCVYFERFRSGKLYAGRAPGRIARAILSALPYVLPASIVIALAVLIWRAI